MRSKPMHRVAMGCAVQVLVAASLFAEPGRIETVDPLTRPAPELSRPLVIPADNQRPEEKIVPRLWQALQEKEGTDEIALIIELQAPERQTAAEAYSPEWDAEQAELAAAIEHRFAARARPLLTGLRGLSHFPMVFGRAAKMDIEKVASLSEVFRVYEDEPVHAFRTQGAALIKADVLRTSNGGTGAGIGVAILDTGIDAAHPEFAGRVAAWGNYTGSGGDGRIDDHGHGTAAAGIVAGASGGMAPLASLWAIKVLNASGSSVASSVLDGLNAVYANRNNFGGLDVVNMSLGSRGPFNTDCDGSSAFNAVFTSLASAGVAIFVSSGNEGDLDGVGHPACHSKVIAVGAVYDGNVGPVGPVTAASKPGWVCFNATSAADQIACYSNSGVPLDILAPADCANTPKPGGGYETCFNGTSAAAPYAAGVAAQLLQLHPGTSPTQLRTALMASGKPLADINGITRSRIDAVAAHAALTGGGPTGPCVQDANTACLLNNRFRVKVRMRNAFDNNPADFDAFRKPVTGFANPNFETAFFYFNSADNIEVLIKMLDQGNVNPQGQPTIALLYGSATPLRIEITVTDTTNGAVKNYSNAVFLQQGTSDFTAFVK